MVLTIQPTAIPDSRTDAELVAISFDEPRAFGVLFDRHADAMFRYAAARVGPVPAEDVVSATFEIAFDRRSRFDSSATSARPWLYGIATNCLMKSHDDERRWLKRGAAAGAISDIGIDELESSIDRADARRLAPVLARALLELTSGERDVLILHALGGLDGNEIAVALGIRRGAARTRLMRARGRLRDELLDASTNATREEAGT